MKNKNFILCISGTPGTGKTEIAKILVKQTDANLISITEIIKKISCRYDTKRKTKIIDIKRLQKEVNKKIKPGLNIIDGHLSHLLKNNLTVILRTNPVELRKRLQKKKWPEKKINENVEAEILGVISAETKGIEIDTSKKAPKKVAKEIEKALNNLSYKKKIVNEKRIDWTQRYGYLLK